MHMPSKTLQRLSQRVRHDVFLLALILIIAAIGYSAFSSTPAQGATSTKFGGTLLKGDPETFMTPDGQPPRLLALPMNDAQAQTTKGQTIGLTPRYLN